MTFVCGKPVVRIEFWADDVVRVTLTPGGKFSERSKHDVPLALDGCYGAPPAVNITDGDFVRLTTARVPVRVDKKPFRLHFLEADGGKLITRNPEGSTLESPAEALKRGLPSPGIGKQTLHLDV